MKLTASQQDLVIEVFGVEVIPDEYPHLPSLREFFGDHTFFADAKGLNIIDLDQFSDWRDGHLVRIASWANYRRSELMAHTPERLPYTVDLSQDGLD